MPVCPRCNCEIIIRELPHQGLKDFRICPECCGSFTVDPRTKQRQMQLLVVLVISLILTLLWYYGEPHWMLPAFISYVVVAILIYRGNKRVYFVPYDENQ